jgi:hypothetical protein
MAVLAVPLSLSGKKRRRRRDIGAGAQKIDDLNHLP